jgi:DNA sulfur modification protein DndD
MKFEILGWESKGLRCPDINLSFKNEKSIFPIVLIQMPNGTGKTTTLDLLRAAMTGEARYWDEATVKDLSRAHSNNAKGRFELRLAVDNVPLTFELKINLLDGRIEYQTTSPSIGGIEHDWKPPVEIRRFLRKEFINLFIFNGELAKELMNPEESAAEDSIDALCQLDLLDSIDQKVNDHWERETKKGGPKSKQGLNAARKMVSNLGAKLKDQNINLKKSNARIAKFVVDIEKIEKQIDSSFSAHQDMQNEVINARDKEDKLRLAVSALSSELMSNLRHPEKLHHAFATGLNHLRKELDDLRLPESTSRQFFDELVKEPICVCGRPLNEECRKAIGEHAAKYLDEDISGFLNSLKSDIEKFVGSTNFADEPTVVQSGNLLGEATDNWHAARTLRENLEKELILGGGDKVKQLAEELGILKSELETWEETRDDIQDINFIERDVDDLPESIPLLEKELREAKHKVDEISGTVELGEKTGLISEIVNRSKKIARDAIRDSIRSDCNKRLEKILENDPIQIENIGRSISLRGQRAASEGQTLSVGYTFLTSVLDRGEHVFPLVVDSPAIPIDIRVRRQVAELIPKLCDQFIGFTITSEREGFVPALHQASMGNIKYLTVFRRTKGNEILERKLPKESTVLTDNGVVIEGQEYYNEFDQEEEA